MTLIIKNANLYDMNNIFGEKKDIIIESGKIKEISNNVSSDDFIDANNRIVTPGIVDPRTSLGIHGSIHPDDVDSNEISSPITPHLRGIDAINTKDESFQDALDAGVTTVLAGPGSSNLIGGTFACIKTYGETLDDMIIQNEIAFNFSMGVSPKSVYSKKGVSPTTRLGNAGLIREALYKAKEYCENKISDKNQDYNIQLESLSRVFDGMLVKFEAHQAQDIVTAVRIAEEFGLNYTIDKASESYLISDFIKKHNVNLVVGNTFSGKRDHELLNQDTVVGKILEDEKIDFAMSTAHPDLSIGLSMIQPIMMMRKGLSRINALKAITINAARSVGIDDKVGSIEMGKDADMIIWNGDPLDYYAYPEILIIDGKIVYDKTKA